MADTHKGAFFLVGFAAIIVIIAGLKAASEIVVPFMLSMFIAIICAPFLSWLTHHKVPIWLAVLIVILLIVFSIGSLGIFVGSSLDAFYEQLPTYRASLGSELGEIISMLNNLGLSISAEKIREHFDPSLLMQMVANTLSSLGGVLTNLFLVLMTVVFILFEAADFPAKLSAAMDDASGSLKKFQSFTVAVNRYLAIKTLVSIGTGFLVSLWLWFIGVDFPVLWGVVAFFLNFVPNIGSLIAAIPAVMLAFVQLGVVEAGFTAFGYFAINLVMGSVIEPRYMGKGLGLSTLVVFLSLLLWGWVFGVVGMLLSIPLTIIVKLALESNPKTRWIALILGSHPETENPVIPLEQIKKLGK
ncbi:AI-2E family transporter [Marinomonas agarivorans]|nr:AI-2E family transporter [Marinomonas agarivorans]